LQNYVQENVSLSEYKTVTIIIPAYNEEKRTKPVLNEICIYVESNNMPWTVIVSIDGNDGT
jgi:glycosyltransferase involved in cell wall biosynthesis